MSGRISDEQKRQLALGLLETVEAEAGSDPVARKAAARTRRSRRTRRVFGQMTRDAFGARWRGTDGVARKISFKPIVDGYMRIECEWTRARSDGRSAVSLSSTLRSSQLMIKKPQLLPGHESARSERYGRATERPPVLAVQLPPGDNGAATPTVLSSRTTDTTCTAASPMIRCGMSSMFTRQTGHALRC